MKQHTTVGYELLRSQGELSVISAHVALLHHERYDGTGYPRGIPGREQHLFGRITAVADVYEALTANRVYRPGYLPHQAFEYILGGGGTYFDPEVVKAFVQSVAVYPIGTEIALSTGQKAVVSSIDPAFPHRPNVRVLYDANGKQVTKPYEIRLSEDLTTMIVDGLVEGI